VNPVRWSLVVTVVATGIFWLEGRGASDDGLRLMGLASGLGLALCGAILGFRGLQRTHGSSPESLASRPHTTRFMLDRRRTPRHDVRIPVRFSVNGKSYAATLVSVSAGGALLRLRLDPGEALAAAVGQPVRIEEYPAGTLARIGRSGVYVDFAVRFEPTPAAPAAAPMRSEPVMSRSVIDG